MRQNKHCDRSYIEGRLVTPNGNILLDSNEVVQPGARVVVHVKPVDAKLYAKHTPRLYTERQWWALTEEQRLEYILNLTYDQEVYVGDIVAMMAAQGERAAPEEDPDVQCRLCWRRGHSPRWCPSKDRPGFVQVSKRRMPHGIPASSLRVAKEEEYDDAFVDATGRLLVLKDSALAALK
jgi:hypothetical protein